MRVFVTGVKGQLGYDVMNELEKQGLEGIGVDIDEKAAAEYPCSDPLCSIHSR